MIFSGYQLGKYLLFPKSNEIVLDRESLVKNGGLTIFEAGIGDDKAQKTRNSIFYLEGEFIENNNHKSVNERTKKNKENISYKKIKIFVKQPRTFEPNYLISFQNEIKINEILTLTNCDSFIPKLITVDKIFKLQFIEFIEYGSFRKFIFGGKPESLIISFLENLAPHIAKYHCLKKVELIVKFQDSFSFSRPLLLALNGKSFYDLLETSSIADHKILLRKIKDSKIFSEIEKIKWSEDCLIHFDLKFDNILYNESNKIKITDWELADIGDINWDLATIFYELLNSFSISIDEIIAKAIQIFNSFLSKYQNSYDVNKIIQYCGIQFLQNYYYGLFPVPNFDIGKSSDWLDKAICFILNPSEYSKRLTPQAQTSQCNITFKEKENVIIEQYIQFNTYKNRLEKDLEDLKKILLKEFTTKPEIGKLKNYIYKWFFGEFEIDKNELEIITENKGKIAAVPTLEKMERWSSYWWKIEAKTKNGNAVVRRSSERRFENSGHFIVISDSNSSTVQINNPNEIYVNLNFFKYSVLPNTAVETSHDFWILGKNKMPQDLPNWVRFYFHLKDNSSGVYLFIQEITKRLNERNIPFEIKLRNNLSRYFRSDAAILFIHRDHYTACADTISIVYNILFREKLLRENTPRFTKKFLKSNAVGLGFGENPIDSNESFGNYRAGIIANILLSNNHWTDQKNWVEIIKKHLFEMGFNLHEMYRNPTSSITEFKYRHDLLEGKINYPPFIGLNINSNIELLPTQRFLKAAQHIAFIICREAIWYGDNCNWISFKKNGNKNNFVALERFEKIGVGLFLSAMAMVCPEENIFKETTIGILKSLNKKINESNKKNYLKFLELFRKEMLKLPLPQSNFENIYYIFLNSWKAANPTNASPEDPLKAFSNSFKKLMADSIINKNIELNLPFPNAYAKDWDDSIGSEFCTTFTHGLAGIGYFFLDLSEDYIDDVKDIFDPLDKILNTKQNY